MVRKIEDARERFESAAIELFFTRGYADATVDHIAAAAGLTVRTFFRYFPDKAEVLFSRAGELQSSITNQLAEAESMRRPLDSVVAALAATGQFFDAHREKVVAREAVVAALPEFQEREMMKMRLLGVAIGEALQHRGVAPAAARMAAEAGVVIWRVAIDTWCSDPERRPFSDHVGKSQKQLAMVFDGVAATADKTY